MDKIPIRRLGFLTAVLIATVMAAIVAYSHVAARPGHFDVIGHVTSPNPRYVADTVVYLDGIGGTFTPPTHPVMFDQRGLRFVPRLLPVVKGTTVRFVNHDTTLHAIYSPEAFYELNILPGRWAEHLFAHRGVFMQLCHLHPAVMTGYVVVLPNPYFAVVHADGSFRIADVPAGTYQLKAWQEHARGDAMSITVPANASRDLTLPLHRASW